MQAQNISFALWHKLENTHINTRMYTCASFPIPTNRPCWHQNINTLLRFFVNTQFKSFFFLYLSKVIFFYGITGILTSNIYLKCQCSVKPSSERQFLLSSSRENTENTGVNGNPPVSEIDPSIGSHIKLQLLDITLLLSACSDGLDKKCLPKRILL